MVGIGGQGGLTDCSHGKCLQVSVEEGLGVHCAMMGVQVLFIHMGRAIMPLHTLRGENSVTQRSGIPIEL